MIINRHYKDKRVCINCNKVGHIYKKCIKPITSHGILCYRVSDETKEFEYLLIQRKDTIGYVDFLRGKYNKKLSKEHVYKNLVEEMTSLEKEKIISQPFDSLWEDLWCNYRSKLYINEYSKAKEKFYKFDISNTMKNKPSKWDTQEFCVPKGRRNNKETPLECSIREFSEETGYNEDEITIVSEDIILEEVFMGSDGITYRHLYYLAFTKSQREPSIDYNNISQIGEVKDVKWMNFKDCINSFRDYDHTKRNILYKARTLIQDMTNALHCNN